MEFVRQRSATLFRTAYVLTGSQDAAEDLVQEALEKACRHWRRISDAESPEAYVRQILVNLANDRWRRLGRVRETSALPDRADPGDAYQRVDLHDEVIRALQTLPMGMRTVVVLHYLHDMGDQQIAGMLGVSPNAVRSQLARGLAKLRANAGPKGRAALLPLPQIEGTR
ncbi:SigE family RNA polymerase sigma factor [Streptacidiphilus sp. PB12-B1b]|nr:SigE family RNA polymerase sigma factor [Streptacidiphilus sp. PB12-B1b]